VIGFDTANDATGHQLANGVGAGHVGEVPLNVESAVAGSEAMNLGQIRRDGSEGVDRAIGEKNGRLSN
jgi:hypothetical protein